MHLNQQTNSEPLKEKLTVDRQGFEGNPLYRPANFNKLQTSDASPLPLEPRDLVLLNQQGDGSQQALKAFNLESTSTINLQSGPSNVASRKSNWLPYENCNYEMELFRWTPLSYYKYRYALTKVLHKSLFRVWKTEVTIGGILFFAVLVALTVLGGYFSHTSQKARENTGIITSIAGAVLFAFTGRNSIWIFLTGVAYERIIVWHKLMGVFLIALGISHAVVVTRFEPLNATGMMLIIAFGTMIVLSFILKFFTYQLFLLFHRLMIVVIIVFVALHGAFFIYVGVGLWGLDVLCRLAFYASYRKRIKAVSANLITESIVELSFPKGDFKFKAGQYAFITLPQVSIWEPHPFSISSSPHDEYVTFHIKILGNWTKALAKMCSQPNQPLSVYIDGPYGSPSIDIESPETNTFLIISGGIGVTPMRSIANWLLEQASRGRKIEKIIFHWAVKDSETIGKVISKAEWLSKFNKLFRNEANQKILERHIYVTRDDLDQSFLNRHLDKSFIDTIMQEKLQINRLFLELNQYVKERGHLKAAVLACGPTEMLHFASSLAKKYRYEFHAEVFEL